MPFKDDYDEYTITQNQEEVKLPSMYKVIMHNDDYTTMEFVITVLKDIFHHSEEKAMGKMLEIHNHGRSIVGIYTYDIAITKVHQVKQEARKEEFPLLCTVEEEN